jgi:xanthine dehydrogenase YagR molybdenum-binding subunit
VTAAKADSPPRIEAALKVTGAARYAADMPVDGLLHAALVVAPIASGRVLSIDAGRALAQSDCRAILTHENAPRIMRLGVLIPLQEPTVHVAGQPVALAIAETLVAARRAAAAIEVNYQESSAVTALREGLDRAFAPPTAGRVATDSLRGDPEHSLADAEVVIDLCYTTPTNNHLPIEPHAVIASWAGNELTVHTTTQAVCAHRQAIAECFGLSPEGVRVVCKYLGGGFGSKGGAWLPCLLLGIMAARHVGMPVKFELTREQMFTLVGRRQETLQRVKLGATRSGHLTAITHDTIAQTSAYGAYADPNGTPARMLYACPNVATSHRLVRVNAPQPNPMRGPGEATGSFALESALDELAFELCIDPIELRVRNYAQHDQHTGLGWSSNSLRECYRVAAASFGWKKRPTPTGALRDGNWRLGWGMASACYPVYRMTSEASVRVERSGAVLVRCATQDIGTGTYTVLAQLAAAALGVPLDRVSVEIGDSTLPEGPYSGGSMATASFTPAVEEAARMLRRRLLALATTDPDSPLNEIAIDRLTIEAGRVKSRNGNQSETIAELVARTAPEGLEALARTAPEERPRHSSYGYGAVFAEVRVDSELGEVRVSRITAAYAAGRILNPMLARGQYIGGLVGGIGLALHEATIVDERLGRIVNGNLADYLIPVHADMPRFDIHLVDEDDPHLGGGIKGIGMLGIVGTAAAIANAAFHATGRRIRDLPIRLESFLGGDQATLRSA